MYMTIIMEQVRALLNNLLPGLEDKPCELMVTVAG
jgi:hypothetical protein